MLASFQVHVHVPYILCAADEHSSATCIIAIVCKAVNFNYVLSGWTSVDIRGTVCMIVSWRLQQIAQLVHLLGPAIVTMSNVFMITPLSQAWHRLHQNRYIFCVKRTCFSRYLHTFSWSHRATGSEACKKKQQQQNWAVSIRNTYLRLDQNIHGKLSAEQIFISKPKDGCTEFLPLLWVYERTCRCLRAI